MGDPPITVRDLRRAWKPHKERLNEQRSGHPTPIRFHRACSWLQRVEAMDSDDDLDLVLACRWIAFNALYGVWDEQHREPMPDRASWRAYLDRMLGLDAGGGLAAMLEANRPLVMSLLEDEYLSKFFWEEPTDKRASQSRKAMYDARTWYQQQQWSLILERTLERVYMMRCQLIHGAATYQSRLNRKSLKRCAMMLEHIVKASMQVLIEHGADEDWGPLCYPPQT